MIIGGLEKMLGFGKQYKTESEKLENPSRRGFLGSIAKGSLALGLAGTGFLKPETALAYDLKDLPPGIKMVKDDALVSAYISMINSGGYNQSRIKDILTRSGGWVEGNIKVETPFTEPAYWFTLNYFNYFYQTSGVYGFITENLLPIKLEELKRKNINMFYWNRGISEYVRIRLNKRGSIEDTEVNLAKAFILSAGRPEEDYKPFLERIKDKNLDSFMLGVLSSFKSQSEVNKLVASWSIFILTLNEYEKTNSKNENYNFIRTQIEEDLIDKKVLYKIRGPPNYF